MIMRRRTELSLALALLFLLAVGVASYRSAFPAAAARAQTAVANVGQGKVKAAPAGPEQPQGGKNYSPYADRRFPTRVYWGDQHLHTSFSPDAGLVGDRHGPDDAYRFARGEQLRSSSGQLVQLDRPYDWLVVSDHAEYLGLPQAFAEKLPDIMKTATGKKWAAALKKGGQAGYEAFVQMTAEFADGKPSIPAGAQAKLARTVWDRAVEAADRNNKPGKFSAFNGFEWTQSIKGNNLHRIVVFRDGPERTRQVLPFSEFNSANVEDLWKYLADYEAKTGGRVMAIPGPANPWTNDTPRCRPASSASRKPASPRATAKRRRSCRPTTSLPTSSAGTRPTSSA